MPATVAQLVKYCDLKFIINRTPRGIHQYGVDSRVCDLWKRYLSYVHSMLCTHVRAILYSRLGSHFTAPYCLSCSGACPLRSSPVLIRSSGLRDRRESNPRLRFMMNFRSQYLTNCATVAGMGLYFFARARSVLVTCQTQTHTHHTHTHKLELEI